MLNTQTIYKYLISSMFMALPWTVDNGLQLWLFALQRIDIILIEWEHLG